MPSSIQFPFLVSFWGASRRRGRKREDGRPEGCPSAGSSCPGLPPLRVRSGRMTSAAGTGSARPWSIWDIALGAGDVADTGKTPTPPAISLAPLRLRSFSGDGSPGHTAAAGHHAQCAGLGVTDGSHRWRWRDRGRLEGTESSRRGWGEARASPSSGHGLRCPTSDTVKSSPHPRTPPNPFTLPTPRESSPSYHVKYQS